MSEQETVQTEASEQSLAESVSELEKLTSHALEVEGEERDQLVEQIKTKCEEEGLTSEEADALLEEIGLVQEARKVKEDKKTKSESKKKAKEDMHMPPKAKDDDEDDSDDDDDSDEEEEEESKKEEVELVLPKTKAAAMNAFNEKLSKLKKADIMANYQSLMKSLDLNEETEEEDNKLEVDVQDDVEALVEGEDLTPEFKEKATTIFEAAVQAKVNQLMLEKQVEIEEQNEAKLQEEVQQVKTELTEQVDGYLNYVADQWMETNKLAVEKGIRTEITESFISGMKNLFNEHYITIPEDKVDVVDDLFQKVEDLESQLNTQIQESVNLSKEIAQYKKEKVVQSVTSGLSDTQAEKVKELAENVDAEDDKLEEKVQVIKENYFPKSEGSKAETLVEEVENNEQSEETTTTPEVIDGNMNRYLSALTKTHR